METAETIIQTFFNSDSCAAMVETYLDLFSSVWVYGIILGTLLEFLGYGIFKAVSLVNINK